MSAVLRRLDDGSTLTIDAVPSATITKPIAVTSYEVEEGVDLSDHARRLPSEARVEGTITETPYGTPIRVNGATVGHFVEDGGNVGEARLRDAIAFLDGCVGKEIEIVFPRVHTIGPVMLSGYSYPITPEKRLALDFTVREIRRAKSRSVAMPRASAPKPRNPDAEPEVDKGTTPTKEASRQSTGKALTDFLGITA